MSDSVNGGANAPTGGSQPLSIFDVKPDNIASFAKPDWGQRTEFFDPKPDKASDKIYRAVIRVLPNIHNPLIPVAIVRYYWFGDGQSGFRYNSASSPNMMPANPEDLMKPIGYCPVSELFWKMKRSGDAQQEKIATEHFSMQSNYICLVQIKHDAVNPANNGKILPYKLPAAIYKRIQSAMNPSDEDLKMGQVPIDVFHPVKGHDIALKITLKDVNGTQMRDYEICTIAPTPSSIFINGVGADLAKFDADPAYKGQVIDSISNLLKEQVDVYSEYGYKEATDDVKRKVKAILSRYEDVTTVWPDLSIAAPTAQPAAATTAAQPAVDPFATPAGTQAPAQQAAPAVQTEPTGQSVQAATTADPFANPAGSQPAAPVADPFANPGGQAAKAAQSTADFVNGLQNGAQ